MAEQLSDFRFPTRGRPQKYKWESWANGNPWKLVKGTDFEVAAKTMQASARMYAKNNNLRVNTAIVDDSTAIIVRFSPAEGGSK